MLSHLCCATGNTYEALHFTELGRFESLADLMSDWYSVQKIVALNPKSFVGFDKVIRENNNSTCLYLSYFGENIFLSILEPGKQIFFRETKLSESYD